MATYLCACVERATRFFAPTPRAQQPSPSRVPPPPPTRTFSLGSPDHRDHQSSQEYRLEHRRTQQSNRREQQRQERGGEAHAAAAARGRRTLLLFFFLLLLVIFYLFILLSLLLLLLLFSSRRRLPDPHAVRLQHKLAATGMVRESTHRREERRGTGERSAGEEERRIDGGRVEARALLCEM